jgi:hypothetical protein
VSFEKPFRLSGAAFQPFWAGEAHECWVFLDFSGLGSPAHALMQGKTLGRMRRNA